MNPPRPGDIRQQISAITEELRVLYLAPDQGRCQLQVKNLKRMRDDLIELLNKDMAAYSRVAP